MQADVRRSDETQLSRLILSVLIAGCLLLLGAGVFYEIHTSALQSFFLSSYSKRLSFHVAAGATSRIVFPEGGPFARPTGYTEIPSLQARLERNGYRTSEQSRFSPELYLLTKWGVSPPYRFPADPRLVIRSANGTVLYDATEGNRLFRNFEDIPPLIVDALLFMENRELGLPSDPRKNPAIEWDRLVRASLSYLGSKLGLPLPVQGGSTLAIQMEKYRYSPEGRTASPAGKLRQLIGASLKAYRGGQDTRAERREIILQYLNTMPLAAVPGLGEVDGLENALLAWFGLDVDAVRKSLTSDRSDRLSLSRESAFKHVLTLLAAIRAPTYYLSQNRAALGARTSRFIRLLTKAGIIDPDLGDRALTTPLKFSHGFPQNVPPVSLRKVTKALRRQLTRVLGVRDFYELNRLHVDVDSTIDAELQSKVRQFFKQLAEPGFLDKHGFRTDRLLLKGDPTDVLYSFLLFESTPSGNLLRAQVDTLDEPFDLNTDMQLELGSTAKLRTLAHYLHILAELYEQFSPHDPERLPSVEHDPITQWAVRTLKQNRQVKLEGFLRLALERRYSASPYESFFTGGGVHHFRNFDARENGLFITVREATRRSTNLVFIRLMRDIVRFHRARLSYDADGVVSRDNHPERRRLLEKAADDETITILGRAFRKYRGLSPSSMIGRLLGRKSKSDRHLALLFLARNPRATEEDLFRWLTRRLENLTFQRAQELLQTYAKPHFNLADHAYLLHRHPLEVWCVGEMLRTPGLTWTEVLARSTQARKISSTWLFRTRHRKAQDRRLRIRIERDAFARMTPYWQALGFPFEKLVPSYASALGSSADRPVALAELLGIILNDGVRRPMVRFSKLSFATATPYHTVLERQPSVGERVVAAAVARVLKTVLAEVVEDGTGRRAAGAFVNPDGTPLVVGGKTGLRPSYSILANGTLV